MAATIYVEGATQLRATSLRLRAAGELGLKREMYAAIRTATAPAKARVQASARATLPHGGGLNEWVASGSIGTRNLISVRSAGVTLRMSKKGGARGHDLRKVEAGAVRHPEWGDRSRWATTRVRPGFWSKPLTAMRPQVAAACYYAMRKTAAEAGFR